MNSPTIPTRRIYVQLGRAGDILNVLPLCKRDADAGRKPALMVAEQFASLLDGVTYVEPLIFRGPFEDVIAAHAEATDIAKQSQTGLRSVVCSQIYGRDLFVNEDCASFVRQSWAQVPGSPPWGSLPLIFDRRDLTRERGVAKNLMQRSTGKPYVVLALSGTSSPFAHGPDLNRYLRSKLGKELDFIDVSGFVAPRFYDLLTLLNGAHAIVTVDSGVLHLAAAVPTVPVVAFITREPSHWHGTAWRPQHVARFYYDEAPECFRRVTNVVQFPILGQRRRILHTFSKYPAGVLSAEDERRVQFAQSTWADEYAAGGCWESLPFDPAGADTSAAIGDPRPVPFLNDLITVAIARSDHPKDIIALTNSDVCFTPGLTGWVLDVVSRHGAAFTHRRDFDRLEVKHRNEQETKRGAFYPGSDAFFFSVEWWNRHGHELPLLYLGREQCDEVLRQLIKRHHGLEIPGAIYHEKHASFWESDEQRAKNPANQHNRRQARAWFVRNGYGPNDPVWWALPAKPY